MGCNMWLVNSSAVAVSLSNYFISVMVLVFDRRMADANCFRE